MSLKDSKKTCDFENIRVASHHTGFKTNHEKPTSYAIFHQLSHKKEEKKHFII